MANSRLPTLADFAEAEHCVLEDLTVEMTGITAVAASESRAPSDVGEEVEIRDRLRGRRTFVRLYLEGWADIEVERRGRRGSFHRIDLRFLDPVPATERCYPSRLLKATAVVAAVTAVFAIPAWLGWLSSYTLPATIAGGTLTALALGVCWYLSHEKIVFRTLHGRAAAIRFGAGLGTIRRFRKLVPRIIEGIANAAESMHDETVVYLRAEMREHYRLRGDGIITENECAESTERILGEFDEPR
jgi:hypothetical protein